MGLPYLCFGPHWGVGKFTTDIYRISATKLQLFRMLLSMRHRAIGPSRVILRAAQLRAVHSPAMSTKSKASDVWKNTVLKWRSVSPKKQKIAYVAGSTTIAVLGLLLGGRNTVHEPADAHDVEALSRIPFSKLFTGWM